MMSVEGSKSAVGPEIVSLLEYVYLGLVVKCQPSVNTSGCHNHSNSVSSQAITTYHPTPQLSPSRCLKIDD